MVSLMAKKSALIAINDILDQLVTENHRLFNEWLFANKLITHLRKIHSKYETIITSEDKQEFNELLRTQEVNQTDGQTYDKYIQCLDKPFDDKVDDRPQESDQSIDKSVAKRQKRDQCLDTSVESIAKTKPKTSRSKSSIVDIKKDAINRCKHRKRHTKSGKKTPKTGIVINGRQLNGHHDEEYIRREKCFSATTQSYKCPESECMSHFKSNQLLAQHITKTHSQRKYFCDYPKCHNSIGFKTKGHLNIHLKAHSTYKPFTCDYEGCDYTSSYRYQLNSHTVKHSDVRPFKCHYEGCDQAFKTQATQRNHFLTHETEAFICPVIGCDRKFRTLPQLRYHSSVHTNQPTIRCAHKDCGQLFFTDQMLYKHRVVAHNKALRVKVKRNYRCEWPGCTFFGRNLVIHSRIHTGEKPYPCEWPECGKSFAYKGHLKVHIDMHLKVKPHACLWPGCTYRCTTKGNLNLHMRVHQK